MRFSVGIATYASSCALFLAGSGLGPTVINSGTVQSAAAIHEVSYGARAPISGQKIYLMEAVTTGYTSNFAQSMQGSGFNRPYGVAVDGSGNVFVSDGENDAVKEILKAGGYKAVNTLGSGFSGPNGVAVDGNGNVFVADSANNAVKEILKAGGYTTANTLGNEIRKDEIVSNVPFGSNDGSPAAAVVALGQSPQASTVWTPTTTYTDSTGVVSFQYPSTWKQNPAPGDYAMPALLEAESVSPDEISPDQRISPDVTFALTSDLGPYATSNLEALFFIYAHKATDDPAGCDTLIRSRISNEPKPPVTINGISYNVYGARDNGLGNFAIGLLYSTFQHGTCYFFETDYAATGSGAAPDELNLKGSNSAEINAHLLTIMQSVHIAKPAPEPTRITVVDAGTAGKPDVVLIPDMASSRAVWDGEAKLLAPNYRLHLVQLNGFGGAPAGGNAAGPILPGVVEELHAYIAANAMHPALIGHSMGGLLTMMLAEKYPADVSKMILVDTLPFYGLVYGLDATADSVTAQSKAVHDQLIAMTQDQFAAIAQSMGAGLVKNADGQKLVAAMALASDRAVFANSMLEEQQKDMVPEMAKIKTPALLLYAYDAAASPDPIGVEVVFEIGFNSMPNVTKVRIDDSGHFIMYDQPAKMDAAIEGFLK